MRREEGVGCARGKHVAVPHLPQVPLGASMREELFHPFLHLVASAPTLGQGVIRML